MRHLQVAQHFCPNSAALPLACIVYLGLRDTKTTTVVCPLSSSGAHLLFPGQAQRLQQLSREGLPEAQGAVPPGRH